MAKLDTINKLLEKDFMLGTLAKEAVECHQGDLHMASLACLFIFTEQGLKMGLDKTEGDFGTLVRLALETKMVSANESAKLDSLRQLRNKLFHESHYMWFYEKDDIVYPFSENETKEVIFNDFSDWCFNLVLRLLSGLRKSQ